MDFIDKLRELAAKIPKLKAEGLIKTEEGTKNALIMPFIQILGYDVFNPLEVTPELVADVGVKKGEKVDYGILMGGQPIMLFECKCFGTNLKGAYPSQLYRYFSVTPARFGIFTDGVIYRFYTDLEAPNKMDTEPFFVFNMLDFRESDVEELKKFSKEQFEATSIMSAAGEMKYKGLLKRYLTDQVTQPSPAFVRVCLEESKAYQGSFFQSVIDRFTPLVREALKQFISEQVDNRLKSALSRETAEAEKMEAPKMDETAEAPVTPELQPIVTTQEEIEAYFIVKSILREMVEARRISMRDSQSYCAILLDDNNRKPICRLRFNSSTKFVGFFSDQKIEERVKIASLDDIFAHSAKLKATIQQYIGQSQTGSS
jgi:hypothetical protein